MRTLSPPEVQSVRAQIRPPRVAVGMVTTVDCPEARGVTEPVEPAGICKGEIQVSRVQDFDSCHTCEVRSTCTGLSF
jgi:hypothetical protein